MMNKCEKLKIIEYKYIFFEYMMDEMYEKV